MPIRVIRITWGSTFQNTVDFRFPVDQPHPAVRVVGERQEAPSGTIEFWEEADFEEIRFRQTLIPALDSGPYTGWYGATGVREFFKAASRAEPFRVYRDPVSEPGTFTLCQMVEGREFRMDTKAQFFGFEMLIRALDGTPFEW